MSELSSSTTPDRFGERERVDLTDAVRIGSLDHDAMLVVKSGPPMTEGS
jgi:hypothetical protein